LAAAEQDRNPAGNPEAPAARKGKQRAFDKPAQAQALQETQGTYATKLSCNLDSAACVDWLPSSVELNHAINWLWNSSRGRLGQLVVENDAVAAAGIELLKQKRAGRATFLPLNKIQPQRFSPTIALRYAWIY